MTILDRNTSEESSAPPGALGVVTFVFCLALFIGGFWLMTLGYDQSSGLLFSAGLIASSLAFFIPLALLPGMD